MTGPGAAEEEVPFLLWDMEDVEAVRAAQDNGSRSAHHVLRAAINGEAGASAKHTAEDRK